MKTPSRWLPVSILTLAAFCAATQIRATEPSTPRVAVSVPPVHSLVASVMAGVGVPVLLIPGTASPHTFSLRPSDARNLADADIVVWVGPALETSLRGALASLAGKAHLLTLSETPGVELLAVREGGAWGEHGHETRQHGGIDDHDKPAHDAPGSHEHGDHRDAMGIDGHIWLSTGNARAIVEAVAAELIERDTDNAAAYLANRDAALQRLGSLTQRLHASLAPVSERPFVVLHDGYRYFEQQFGLNIVGAISVSPEIRPGARRLVELRAHVRALNARCIFAEPQLNASLVRTVAEGTGARTGTLDPIGATLTPGPALYARLLENLAAGFTDCLAADG